MLIGSTVLLPSKGAVEHQKHQKSRVIRVVESIKIDDGIFHIVTHGKKAMYA